MKPSEKIQPKQRDVIEPKPPAPRNPKLIDPGTEITLRDLFACFALARGVNTDQCYPVADQMLAARGRR